MHKKHYETRPFGLTHVIYWQDIGVLQDTMFDVDPSSDPFGAPTLLEELFDLHRRSPAQGVLPWAALRRSFLHVDHSNGRGSRPGLAHGRLNFLERSRLPFRLRLGHAQRELFELLHKYVQDHSRNGLHRGLADLARKL